MGFTGFAPSDPLAAGESIVASESDGGTYARSATSPTPYTTPLEVAGQPGQVADLFSINATRNGQKLFWVDAAGNVHSTGNVLNQRADQTTQINWYSAKDYGAIGNNVVDDAPAIGAALAAAAVTGGVLWMGWGNFKLGSTITIPSNVQIIGSGNETTVFYPVMGIGTVFNFGAAGTQGQALKFCGITHPAVHTDTSIHIENSQYPRLDDILITNGYNCVDIGNDANASAGNFDLRMNKVVGACISTGCGISVHRGGNAWYATDCFFKGTHTAPNPAATSFGLNCSTTYPIDTFSLINCGFYGFYHNVYCGPGSYVFDLFITNSLFDGAYDNCIHIADSSDGTFSSSQFVNCYIHSDNQAGYYVNPGIADGASYDVDFIGCLFGSCGTYAVNIAGQQVRRTRFIGCKFPQAGTAAIFVGPNCGSDDGSGPIEFNQCDAYTTANGKYGVYLSAGATNIAIKGGRYGANTNPFYLGMGLNGCAALGIYIKDAEGFGGTAGLTNYGPIVAGATPNYGNVTVPAFSGQVLTNPFPSDMVVYVSGGSVSSLYAGVGTGSSQKILTGLVSGVILVPYKGTLTYGGSGAPNVACMLQ